jgi:hypothetical protein
MPIGNYDQFGNYVPGGAYKDDGGYLNAYNDILSKYRSKDQQYNNTTLKEHANQELETAGSTFATNFRNMVGRDPNAAEASQFFEQMVRPNVHLLEDGKNLELNDAVTSFVSQNYQKQANDYVNQQLQAQQSEASRLGELSRTQGRQAINSTEQSLMDYQNRLFEKLRPQLLTSLQSQGLLNTGGLNEAFAGAAGDLAASSQQYLADANLQNEQAANAIAFSGASAPYQYQQNNLLNQVPQMQQSGQNALNRSFQTYTDNLNFGRQQDLMRLQSKLASDAQPGLLGRLGQNFVSNFGSSAGQAWGKQMTPQGAIETYKML